MRASLIVALLFTLSLAGFPIGAPEPLESVEAKVRQAWDKIHALSGVIGIEATLPIGEGRLPVHGSGTVDFLRDAGKNKYREQITVKTPEPMTLEAGVDVIFDGVVLYVTTEFMGKKDTSQSAPDLFKGAVPPGGGPLLEAMKSKCTLTVKPDALVDGKPCWTLEARLKEPIAEAPVQKGIVYFDKETGLARKMEVYESDTVVLGTATVSNVKVNPELSPRLFVYVPPPSPPPPPPAAPTPPPIPPTPAVIK